MYRQTNLHIGDRVQLRNGQIGIVKCLPNKNSELMDELKKKAKGTRFNKDDFDDFNRPPPYNPNNLSRYGDWSRSDDYWSTSDDYRY